jgi:hypothetical protein
MALIAAKSAKGAKKGPGTAKHSGKRARPAKPDAEAET